MNLVVLTGNLAGEPTKSYTNSNMAVTKFTIAVNRISRREGGDTADFIRVTVFDKQAENVERYLRKGSKVGVEGRIQTGSYEKDGKTVYTTDVIANRVEFLESKRDSENRDGGFSGGQFSGPADNHDYAPAPAPTPKQPDDQAKLPGGFDEINDDDMPF